MKHHSLAAGAPVLVAAILGVWSGASGLAADTSSIVDVSGAFSARDLLTGDAISGGFTVFDGHAYTWSNDWNGYLGFRVGDLSTGNYTSGLKPSFPIASNGFGDPFGAYDAENGIFYAGTYDDAGSGMYRYVQATQTWSSLGVFESLYGVDIFEGEIYASGLNEIWNGSTGQGNQIALYDLTGGSSHDVLIQATGNSAHVALDISGNLYYANYLPGGGAALYRWTAAQLESVRADKGHGTSGGNVTDLFLTYDDAELLTLLPEGSNGANGIAVDEGGNVFVTANGSASALLMWNESMGLYSEVDEYHFEIIAGADSSLGWGWFGAIDTTGDFLDGGSVFMTNSGSNGLAEITFTIPEPSAALYLLTAGGLLGLWRMRKPLRAA